MANFCLTKQAKENLLRAVAKDEITPDILMGFENSALRREYLKKYVGEEASQIFNAQIEKSLLKKNQELSLINTIKSATGIKPEIKRDLISKVRRMEEILAPKDEKSFYQDAIKSSLKIEPTMEEAKTVSDLSKKITDLESKANKDGIFGSKDERLSYGMAKVNIENYINDLKLKAKGEGKFDKIIQAPGLFKSLQSSLDNSFFGRQGIKVLYNNPDIWARNFIKSWGDISKELKGRNAIDLIKADIYSRPNALNGKYKVGGYGLDVLSEEAYPTSIQNRIPILGRLFKASESAYNGAALRIRADLADKFIGMAEREGINMLNKENAQPVGDIIGSLTGRGKTDYLSPKGSKAANIIFYSVKFLQSNIDTLIAPAKYIVKKVTGKYGSEGEEFAGRKAAKATVRIIGTIATILTIAKLLNKDSVDEDPRSTNFGKIKMWGRWVDITGGMAGLVRLAARLVPTYHNGVWSNWRKSSTGNWVNLKEKGFNKDTALDELENFTEGKLAPIAGTLRDYWKDEFFGGEPFTWGGAAQRLISPLPLQNSSQILKDPKSEFALGTILLEELGFSSTTTSVRKTDWEQSTSKELQQFKKEVGSSKFKKANDDYNRVYEWWLNDVSKKDSYKRLSDEDKKLLQTKAKDKVKKMIFDANDFKPVKEKKTKEQTQETNDLLP